MESLHTHLREHHRRHHRRLGPIGRFVRLRLRRRIFVWFAGGIIATMALTSLVFMVLGQESSWRQQVNRGIAWAGQQFASHWDDPRDRAAFTRETAQVLELDIQVRDSAGQVLEQVGEPCRHRAYDLPVTRGPVTLGSVRVCDRTTGTHAWRFGLGFAIAIGILWLASGKVARRLARPLDELAEVVRRVGTGDLTARASLSCEQPDEIGVVAEAVNDMASRIEKQLADQRELLAAVSHELRTPLARVRIISEIARDTGATPKTYDDLDREVEEMDSLVGQLLASSRLDFGVLAARPLSVRDVVTRAVERAGLPPTHAELEGEHDAITADATLLQRALANLIDNAKKHAGGAERVRVVLGPERVTFDVLDRGPGLPEGGEAALFKKFQRKAEGSSDGLGLGLALVKRIAEAHGGTVWARPRDGGGAVFGFSVAVKLPAA